MSSEQDDTTPQQTGPDQGARAVRRCGPRKRAIVARAALWMVFWVALLTGSLVWGGVALLGKPLNAPDWLRAEIEARLARQMPGYELSFSEMTLYVQSDLRPEIALEDVELRQAETGRLLLELSHADIKIARRAIFEGRLQPRSVSVAGVFLRLRRGADGALDLAFGDGLGEAGIGLNGLIEKIDDFVYQPQFAALREIEINAVTLQFQDARARRSWTVDGGRLALSRESEILQMRGDFALLSGRSYAATLEVFGESAIGSNAVSLGVSVTDVASGDIASQSAALAWLGVLRAPISGSLRTSFHEDGRLGPLSATLSIGEGVVQPSDATRPIPFTSARSYFTYDPAEETLRFNEIAVVSDWINATGDGSAVLEGTDSGLPSSLQGQVSLAGISANPVGLYDAPQTLTSAALDFHLALDPFVLRIGRLALSDTGQTLRARGRVEAAPEGWDISVMGQLDEIAPDRLLGLWPAGFKPKTRDWVATNVLDGRLRNMAVRLRAYPDGAAPDLFVSAEVAEARVRFMKTLPPVTDASGLLQFENNRLAVSVDSGTLTAKEGGALDVAGTVFTIPDVRVRRGPAQVQLKAAGPVHAALWVLNQEPMRALDKAGRPVDLAHGRVQASGQIDFPLKKKPAPGEVSFAVAGRGFGVSSRQIVPGKPLAAKALSFTASNRHLRIEGAGTLAGVPFDGSWETGLGPGAAEAGSQVVADVTLSQETLDTFNITLPPGSVSGQGQGRLELALAKGRPPEFSLTSDLAGLGLRLDAIGWSMGQARTGTLAIDGVLGKPVRVDSLALSGPGLDLEGRLTLRESGGLQSLAITRLRAGSWLDAPVTLTGRGRGSAPAVQVSGGRIDMRNAPFTSTSGSGGGTSVRGGAVPGPLTLAPDRLQLTDGIVLTDFRGDFALSGGMKGNFTARLNGGVPVRGSVSPTGKGSRFVIKSEDAGAVLRDAGLLKNMHGGTFHLKLLPTGAAGTFDGELDIRDTRIRNAPVMADLLNAISVIGLLEQLGGQGISFPEVEARFRLTPKQVILTRSSAVGPSMGISLDGYYDLASQTMDMQGVLSPIYVVNFVGQLFSRKGEGLFGFNFNLRGKASAPKITVNPLSALTPGMFREIFRRPPPKVPG
ncbi:Large exoproteins involved in heme utilization or adhesion [Marinovum algicola DG 898]|nr:Large exoproteins involved in heme utilization or adhesion [Marinovum algicola DG 898]